ncbi:MAG: TIGR04222 domain-containing membrane protein [Acidobacteria bacterium]|nr:TIGR04222 domain-containing membrane protein [Acidobacteriota bacterium]
MEILFDNPLANMYGPYFLALYGVFIVATVVGVWVAKRSLDKSDRLTLPSIPPNIDPYEIAYLRGGQNELARAAAFSLRQRGLVEIKTEGSTTSVRRTDVKPANINQIEWDALDWIGPGRRPQEFFAGGGLSSVLERHGNAFQTRLERQQLINGASQKAGFAPFKWAALLSIVGLGAYKATAALIHGRSNIGLLMVFALGGIILTLVVGQMARLTKLGKSYLERLQLAFDSLKYESQRPYNGAAEPVAAQAGLAGVDPLLLTVGVFGTGILAGTMFSDYNDAFRKAQASDSCGSSCGSCTSSDSSSGDGGSSCGGGGCGGCGGGD